MSDLKPGVIQSEAKDPLKSCRIALRKGILRFAQDDTSGHVADRGSSDGRLRMKSILTVLCLLLFGTTLSAATITGTVTAAGGAPLPSMTIAVYGISGLQVATATSNAQGSYSVSVPAGTYRLLAFDPMGVYATSFYNGASCFETSLELTLTNDASFTANFILIRAGRITGVVQAASSEEPLAQMTVAAYNEDGSRRGLVTTGAGGGYTIVLPPGNYRVVAYDDTAVYAVQFFRDRSDFESADIVPVTSGATSGAVDFKLPRSARASGSVSEALTGIPLGGITIAAYDSFGRVLASTTTSPQGGFSFAVPPVPFRLAASDPSGLYASTFLGGASSFEGSAILTPVPEQLLGGLQFAMTKGGRIEGRIIDAAGAALAGITVTAWNPDGSIRGTTTTGSDGRYSLVLPQGSFRVGAHDDRLQFAGRFFDSAPDFASGHLIPVIGQTTTGGIDFVLAIAGRMSGTTYRAGDGAPLVGIVLTAWDASGRVVATTRSKADGTFILAVAPGSYRLVAHDPEFHPDLYYATTFYGGAPSFALSQQITVLAGQESPNLLMPMAIAGRLTGFVRRRGDIAAVNGATIHVYDLEGNEIATADSDSTGNFNIPLPSGSYKVAASDRQGRFNTIFYAGFSSFGSATVIRINASETRTAHFTVDPAAGRRRRPARLP